VKRILRSCEKKEKKEKLKNKMMGAHGVDWWSFNYGLLLGVILKLII